jgi:hypothetical protein
MDDAALAGTLSIPEHTNITTLNLGHTTGIIGEWSGNKYFGEDKTAGINPENPIDRIVRPINTDDQICYYK